MIYLNLKSSGAILRNRSTLISIFSRSVCFHFTSDVIDLSYFEW